MTECRVNGVMSGDHGTGGSQRPGVVHASLLEVLTSL